MSGVITPISGVITLLTTGRGPLCTIDHESFQGHFRSVPNLGHDLQATDAFQGRLEHYAEVPS